MSLVEELKKNYQRLPHRNASRESELRDALAAEAYPEIIDAVEAGFCWRQIFDGLRERYREQGIWDENWTSSQWYSAYIAYRRFKSIEESKIKYKYEKGEGSSQTT